MRGQYYWAVTGGARTVCKKDAKKNFFKTKIIGVIFTRGAKSTIAINDFFNYSITIWLKVEMLYKTRQQQTPSLEATSKLFLAASGKILSQRSKIILECNLLVTTHRLASLQAQCNFFGPLWCCCWPIFAFENSQNRLLILKNHKTFLSACSCSLWTDNKLLFLSTNLECFIRSRLAMKNSNQLWKNKPTFYNLSFAFW